MLLPAANSAAAPPATAASTSEQQRNEEMATAIRAAMEKLQVPGASVAVADKDKIVWAAGFGDTTAGSDKKVTPETLFQAASISKPIVALATLRLVERGELDLDAKVNDQLKSWKIPDNGVTEKTPIKLRHLLSHSSGLSVHGFGGYSKTAQRPTLVEVLDGKKPANSGAVRPFLRPGDRFQYSGGGYCVLQQLLIDTSGKPFPEFMQETVLKPAGMTHSTYEQPLPDALTSQAAVGHRAKLQPIAGDCHVYPEMAAAGLWTTPSDLVLAAIDVAKSFNGQGGHLLSQKMAQAMLTRENKAFGLGFTVTGEGNYLEFGHGGSNEGFRCHLLFFPATGQGMAIMTNSDTGGPLCAEIEKIGYQIYAWPVAPKKGEG
jgi:CubicO group peptidase (beta-lactamase class C family)